MTTKTATTKKTSRKKSSETVRVNMEMGVATSTDDSLNSLLADLGVPSAPPEEPDEIVIAAEPGELELEAVVASVENQEAMQKAYADGDETPAAETKPTTAEDKKAAREAAKAAKALAKAERQKARDEAKAKREAEKANRQPRKFYASKVERVTDKLGAELGSYTVLTLADAALTGEALEAKQKETLDVLNEAGLKVQNRITMLLEYCAGKSKNLNEVIARAFKLLKKDGHIKSGEKGNFHIDLLAKPYSAAAARAMGNNTLAAMKLMKVIQKNEEGVYVANPESLILMKVNGMLGL